MPLTPAPQELSTTITPQVQETVNATTNAAAADAAADIDCDQHLQHHQPSTPLPSTPAKAKPNLKSDAAAAATAHPGLLACPTTPSLTPSPSHVSPSQCPRPSHHRLCPLPSPSATRQCLPQSTCVSGHVVSHPVSLARPTPVCLTTRHSPPTRVRVTF
jgi:hypothetical protein